MTTAKYNPTDLVEYIYGKLPSKEFVKSWLDERPDRLEEMRAYLKMSPEDRYPITKRQRKQLNVTMYYFPELFADLFAEPKPIEIPLTPLQKKQKSAVETIEKLGLAGVLTDTSKALDTAIEKGYLPDVRGSSWWGAMGKGFMFPLKKIMEALNIFPRTEAALMTQAYRKAMQQGKYPTVAEFNWQDYISGKYPTSLNPLENLNIGKEGWKEVAKAAFEPLYNVKSPYAGTGFTQAYKEMFAGTKFAEPFKVTEGWEKGNWWQRLVSGFAGSPADIAGFASDVIFSPETYLTAGLGRGAVTGINLADDLIKQGVKILPKGAAIGLTKAGRKAFGEFVEEAYPNVFKAIDKGLISPGAVVKGLDATDEIAKATAKNVLTDRALNKFLQEIPDAATTYRYLDLGGTKFMGQTLIPGYKYAEVFGKLKNTQGAKVFMKLFNENVDIPDEFVPVYRWLQKAGEAEKSKWLNEIASIVKEADKSELDKVQKYLWLQADIERANNRLNKYIENLSRIEEAGVQGRLFGYDTFQLAQRAKTRVANLIDKYNNIIDELSLTKKQLDIANQIKDFWARRADDYFRATGNKIDTYEFYTPIRYITEEGKTIKKISELGAAAQPFEKARKITMAQAEALGLKPKSFVESTMQRLWEQQSLTTRTRVLNQIKQFASDTAQEGFFKVEKIPQLKGLYLPNEYKNVIENSYNLFFGDKWFEKALKVYDKGLTVWKRWALATPGYHFRNFYTDNISGLMEYGPDFYNPKYWSNAMAIFRREHKPIILNGVKRYADDIYDEMLETGEIALTTQYAVETDLLQKSLGKLGKAKDVIRKISPAEYSLKAGQFRENFGRIIAGVIERDAGASKIMAAANVKKVFFDYAHSLTPFEQQVLKRIVPFYTWLKNNIRRQIQLLFTRTGAYATIPKAAQFMENISKKPEGYEEFKPDYYTDLLATLTPLRAPGLPDWMAGLLGRERTTEAGIPLVLNPNLAFQDWSRLSFKDFMSAMAPQIKVPLELYFDRQIFFGTPIEKDQKYKQISKPLEVPLSKLPDSWLEKLGFLKTDDGRVLASPKVFYLMNQLPQYALTQRGFAGTELSPYQNLSALLGIKFFPYQEEKQKERYIRDWMEKVEREIRKYEQKTGQELPTTSQIESAYREIYKNAIEQKYQDVLTLKELLDVVGSNKEMDLILKELLKPYYEEIDKAKGKELIDLKKLLEGIGIEPTLLDVQNVLLQRGSQ